MVGETFGGKIFNLVDTIVAILYDFFPFFRFYIRAFMKVEIWFRTLVSWIRHVLRVRRRSFRLEIRGD